MIESRLSPEQERLLALLTPASPVTTVKRVDTRSFMERLFEQRNDVVAHLGRDGAILFMGPRQYEELMVEDSPRFYFSFKTDYKYGMEICGLKVRVIPWFDGLLIVPADAL